MYQIQSQELRTLTTAHLAQTMSLLALNIEELGEKIHSLLAENPALELEEPRRCPQCLRPLRGNAPCPVCSHPTGSDGEPVVFISHRWDIPERAFSGGSISPDEAPALDEYVPEERNLALYILRQIAPALTPAERPLAAHILSSLDEDGLLPVPLLEIARYHHVPPSRVESVLHRIQRCDPPGAGASTPREALLIQLEILSENREVPPLARQAIEEHLEHLGRYQVHELSLALGITKVESAALAQFIRENLNPYPARAHWGDWHHGAPAAAPVYRRPDALIRLASPNDPDSPLVVEILSPLRGQLRLNPLFRRAIAEMKDARHPAWQKDLERARLLIKSLGQRNQALAQLLRYLARKQRRFILQGDSYLTPLTRAQVAAFLGVHESTVSRAVAGKTVQLPNRRIIPLERFFDRSLPVRAALRTIVAQEEKPLSDSQLANRLKALGYPIARRTVAKYRQMEGILPARLRHGIASHI